MLFFIDVSAVWARRAQLVARLACKNFHILVYAAGQYQVPHALFTEVVVVRLIHAFRAVLAGPFCCGRLVEVGAELATRLQFAPPASVVHRVLVHVIVVITAFDAVARLGWLGKVAV